MGLESRSFTGRTAAFIAFVGMLAVLANPVLAVVKPDATGGVRAKEYRDANLYIGNIFQPVDNLQAPQAAQAFGDLAALGAPTDSAYMDIRSGRWGTLLPVVSLIPGDGVGNDLSWNNVRGAAPASANELADAAWEALAAYIQTHSQRLNIDLAEIQLPVNVAVHDGGDLIQINARRAIGGIEVRDTYVTAVISHGNLVLLGTRNWADINVPTTPTLSLEQGISPLRQHLSPNHFLGYWKKHHLVILPMARGTNLAQIPFGQGYDYRLAWVISPDFPGDMGKYQGLVDAHTGELLLFEDTAQYAAQGDGAGRTIEVKGGVLPVSNDGVPPDGVEQAGWPMPFADVTVGGETFFTDEGGNLLQCVDGTVTSVLDGRYMRMDDQCGAISLSSNTNMIDFGTSGGTDCTTPGIGGTGNTHASRSGFYEINRIKEMARAQLPGNEWLKQKLTARMNINQNCNANWSGTVNFYTSGGGCGNTGELAGVFDHEWGHGMDANDVNPGISSPGEGIADIYAGIRLNDSCMGRNFRLFGTCGGYGDPCTVCSGVRDIDWANRNSGQPHTLQWIDANCGSGGGTPCGGSTHCEGAVYAEASWDLFNRDFQAAPYNMDLNTALEVTTRLVYLGAGPVGRWYQCTDGTGTGDGCNADGGYLNYLAADDDNGNLNDGTPHMVGINSAYSRHTIACPTPAVADSGCAGAPTTAPVVVGTALDRGARLTWGAVAGATKYQIFRTDGVFGCDFGKTKVGETTDLAFVDSGLQNGRDYFYTVMAIGPSNTCMGPASACTTVRATAGGNIAAAGGGDLTFLTGDGDAFIDNCESAQVEFTINSVGGASQTNVRISGVAPVGGGVSVLDSFPIAVAASLAPCASAQGTFSFEADGLSTGDTVAFDVTITSDELAALGASKTVRLNFPQAESNANFVASQTYTFEGGGDGWTVEEGVFDRTNTGGGGNGTSFYRTSTDNTPNACDHIRSPVMVLSATSTLSLYNQYDIEGVFNGTTWYDRANVGTYDVQTGARSVVSPDGGRAYNASGANGTCGTADQPGWADTQNAWGQSTFTAAAMGSADKAGDLVQLDIRYGTDGLEHGFGFHFDEVTVTDVSFLVPDTQSNTCAPDPIFDDGFESGDTTAWSETVTAP